MRILVVAMPSSIHTMRWLEQFDDDDEIDFLMFPSIVDRISLSKMWKRIPLKLLGFSKAKRKVFCYLPIPKVNTVITLILTHFFQDAWKQRYLIKTIKKYKPDIIHSLEFQNAGYLCLNAREKMGADFPTWIATNWGSDIYLFRKLRKHRVKIEKILSLADFYSAECQRDYDIASDMNMKAKPLPVIPNSGGMRLSNIEILRNKVQTSQRDLIVIKSYQLVFGRTLSILKSLEQIVDIIKEKKYRLCFFSATSDIILSIELFAEKHGLDVEIISADKVEPHAEILSRHSKARCYIGASISDGISTSMLEAMALGAFPIQTCTSCANEWVENGVTGFMPECDDINAMASMIKTVLTDDNLVDTAAEVNWNTIVAKASYEHVQEIAKSFYTKAYAYSKTLCD